MNKYKIISNKKCNHGYSFFECCIECDKNKERFMNPDTGEYYYIGNDKTKKYICEHDIYYKLCNVCEQYTRKYNTKTTIQRLTDENNNRYYIGKDNTKKYVCEHDINKIYCPKCKYLCIHLTKKSKCTICKNSDS